MMSPNRSFPTKEDLIESTDAEIPEGWEGGEAYHTGGNIWVREFTNDEEDLRVTYSLSGNEPGVALEAVAYDEGLGMLLPVEVLEENEDPETDEEKFAAAVDLIKSA